MEKQTTVDVINAAINIHIFAKTHLWPTEGSKDFMEFTELLDKLETKLAQTGWQYKRG